MGKWTVAGWIGLPMVFVVFSFLLFVGGWWVFLVGWCGGGGEGGEGMVWFCGRRGRRRGRRRYEIIKRKVVDLHQVLYVVYLYLANDILMS